MNHVPATPHAATPFDRAVSDGDLLAASTGKAATKVSYKDVVRVCSGNFLEMYDFMVFGYYASSISKAFFPSHNPFASLMLSLMTFGAGFLMRPLGAVILGAYTDKLGRRAGLILTLAIMSVGTASLALTPGYKTIGIAAPLLVLAGRLLQGFSAGVELGNVSVYLAEIAPPNRRGFYVSWQSASQQLAVVFAAGLGVILNSLIPAAQMEEWGWRVPLLIGCAIIPLLFLLRSSLKETDAFLKRPAPPKTAELLSTLAKSWPMILAGMMMVTMTTVTFYLSTAYTPTLGRNELHLSAMDTMVIALFTGVSNFLWLPVMGALSDRIGRRAGLFIFTLLGLTITYPAMMWLVSAPSFGRLLTVDLWLSFLFAGFNGSMVVYLAEFIPAKVRATGFSLAYSLATAIFGGFTPAICTALIHTTHDKAIPGAWAAAAALMGLLGVLWAGWLSKRRLAAGLTDQTYA
ncbi:MFS transporter [Caulobacter sp. S45]|jgi:MFS family permease|uniref:MFS transporter n=1 Tax=Caulobacter sp. S45 TaxID=1641861 RepID=UPI00131E6D66|nr:MFS transporter [Caulobacter sp. S45]